MKKKIAFAMALILACGCLFAACGDKTPANKGENGTSEPDKAAESQVPIVVSETEYIYATNADGSYETVIATDAEGNTHSYLKGVKPGSQSADGAAAQTEVFEIQNSSVVSAFVDILNSGNFEMDGFITSDGEKMPLSFRTIGKDIRMGTEISGIALEFALLGDKTYLVSNEKKAYIELTDSIKKELGFNDSDLHFDGFGTISNDDTVKSSGTYNGKEVEVYTATSAEGTIKFYVDGDKLVKLEMYDTAGVCSTMIETTLIRGNLSAADMQIPSDYQKQSYLSFISSIIGEM